MSGNVGDEKLWKLWNQAYHTKCWAERIVILQKWSKRLKEIEGKKDKMNTRNKINEWESK